MVGDVEVRGAGAKGFGVFARRAFPPGEFAVLAPPGCYLNHSCDPNAMRHGVKVFAWRTIEAGEEITIDYRLNASGGDSWPCRCGTAACTGVVEGSFFAMPDERQRLLLPHAPAFIRREERRRRRAGAVR